MNGPQLPYKNAYVVDCHDLDKFVNMHLEGYGIAWRSLDTDQDGYHNGSYAQADVKFGNDIEIDTDQNFNIWLLGGAYYQDDADGFMSNAIPGVEEMMQWLCNIGQIPEGKYVVKLWW